MFLILDISKPLDFRMIQSIISALANAEGCGDFIGMGWLNFDPTDKNKEHRGGGLGSIINIRALPALD
jgi:hypothetical protein